MTQTAYGQAQMKNQIRKVGARIRTEDGTLLVITAIKNIRRNDYGYEYQMDCRQATAEEDEASKKAMRIWEIQQRLAVLIGDADDYRDEARRDKERIALKAELKQLQES